MSAPSTPVDELGALTRLRQRMLGRTPEGLVVGRYRLIRPLGQGGMGEVWLADDPRLARKVALKLLHRRPGQDAARARARLLREAQAIAQITHPNVVAVFDCGSVVIEPDEPPRAFIAMELVDGKPLDAWLAASPRSIEEILGVFIGAGRGLAAAHSAGQVHRDFKPANVMVGPGGEAKVLDFGLVLYETDSQVSATALAEEQTSRVDSPGLDTSRLTEPGLVMGTPRYMAPEQHTGGIVTAASDQFSFCCALLEALQRESPFGGHSHDDLGRAKLEGRIHRGTTAAVPGWLRDVVERGLGRTPEQRWPSMTVLLRRLRPRRSGRLVLGLAGGGGLLLAAAFGLPEHDRCGGSTVAWSRDRAQMLTAALGGPDDPQAGLLATRIDQKLTDYDAKLATNDAASCAAHRDESIDAKTFDRRVGCLRQRRADFDATVLVLADADVASNGRADRMINALPDPDACLDDERLDLALAVPDDAEAALAVNVARVEISTARALMYAGKHADALAAFEAAGQHLVGVEFPPIHAELEHELGRLLAEMGDARSIEMLEHALLLAEACGHDRIAAEAASTLIYAMTQQPTMHDRALALIGRGDALVRRAGDPPALRGRYWMAIGGLRLQRMEYEASFAAYQRSYASLASVLPEDDPEVGVARVNLGTVLRNLERYDEAIEHHREVFLARERTMGVRHPRTIKVLINLAQDHEVAERYEAALPLYQDAIERAELGLGPNHPDLAFALGGLGRVARSLRRFDDSRVAYLRALAIADHRGESMTADTAMTLSNLGNLERQTDRLDDARLHLEQALAMRERFLGPRHYFVGQTQHTMAGVELLAGNYERARTLALNAIDIFTTAAGTHRDELSNAEVRVATAFLELGRLDEAERHLELAMIAAPEKDEGYLVALGRSSLAQGNAVAASKHFADAIEASHNPWDRGGARTYLAIALRAAGDASGADAALERAHAELVEAGAAGRAGLRVWASAARRN